MSRICRYVEIPQSLREFHIPGRHWMKWLRKLQETWFLRNNPRKLLSVKDIQKYTVQSIKQEGKK